MILPYRCKIERLSPTAGNADIQEYATIIANAPMDIQPASAELTALSEGKYGQVFRAFTSVSGIVIGDRITISGTNRVFITNGVNNWFRGPLPHLELVLNSGDG